MKKIRIVITMAIDNDAFNPDPAREIIRIVDDGTLPWVVHTACDTLGDCCSAHIGRIVKDANGNTVGRVDAEVTA